MKNLFRLNLFFVGFPIVLCLLGIIDNDLIFWGLLSTILTGLFQLIIGLGMLHDDPKDKMLQWYAGLVFIFFGTWIASGFIAVGFDIMHYMIPLPPFLALYLTFIIYKKMKQ